MIRVYTSEEKAEVWNHLYPGTPYIEMNISRSFSNLFNSYAKSIQKAYGRTGSIFEHPYHRIPVRATSHFKFLIPYIHKNPQKHGFVDDFRDWPYSSYQSLISIFLTRIKRDETLEWFGGADGFHQEHILPEIYDGVEYLFEVED